MKQNPRPNLFSVVILAASLGFGFAGDAVAKHQVLRAGISQAARGGLGRHAILGFWGDEGMPVLARLSAGLTFGPEAQADLGVQLNPADLIRAYFALTGGGVASAKPFEWARGYIGPSFGLNYDGFWAQLGPDLSFSSLGVSNLIFGTSQLFFHAQLGYGIRL